MFLLITAMCGIQFPTRYDRVENTLVRPLAFVYDNHTLAEGSPGDTITLHSYYAGERVSSIDWTIAMQVLSSDFGVNIFGDPISLSTYTVPGSYHEYFGGTTDSATLDFVIPADIIRKQFASSATVMSLLPAQTVSLIPPSIASEPVQILVDALDDIASKIPNQIADLPYDPAYQWLTTTLQNGGLGIAGLEPLLQIFSINIKIFALVNGKYNVESTYTVRYNDKFHFLDSRIPVNHNPVINWIEVCRLKKGASSSSFDPIADADKIDTTFRLDIANDTVPIDEGYHYFLVCDSAVASLDSGYSLTSSNVQRENLLCDWLFRDEDQVPGIPLDSLVALGSGRSNAVELLPPVDTRMQHFSLWLVGYDRFRGERLRPVGFTFLFRHGVFRFSEAYKNAHQ
jgi:hypothetical protein